MGNQNQEDTPDETDLKTVGARLKPTLQERIEDHKEREGYTTDSENIRALFRKGLEHDEDADNEPQYKIGISGGLIWAGSLMIATQIEITLQTVSGDWVAVLGFLLVVLGVVYGYVKE